MNRHQPQTEISRAIKVDPEEIEWEVEVDVVVVGSGAAGHAAALAAQQRGSSVVILEKASHVGGTTAKSGGAVYWIPNNSLMRDKGIEDDRVDAIRYMARVAYPLEYRPEHITLGLRQDRYDLIAAFYDSGAAAVDELTAIGALDPALVDIPDYQSGMAENKASSGRELRPAGVSLADGGTTLIAGLTGAAERGGIETVLDRRVVGLFTDESGQVIGVQAQSRRDLHLFRARQAVIFASGGFVQDAELSNEYLRGPVFGGCAASTSTGDFVRLGIDIGADLGNMSNAWWAQSVLDQLVRSRSTSRDITFNFGDSMVFVNKYGRRVVNEKSPYNDRGQVHHYWNPALSEYSNLLLFMVYDDDVAQSEVTPYHRNPIPLAGEYASYVITGETLEDLASAIDERLKEFAEHTGGVALSHDFATMLEATIHQFNGYAVDGTDPDFRRGETPVEHTFHAPDRGDGHPNPTMHPFRESGPYHAIILAPAALDTKGGPRTDPDGRVVDVVGDPIAGLYGAGNCVASVAGEGYWGAGGTIGPALTFGYRAGIAASHEARR